MAEFQLSREEYVSACRALGAKIRVKVLLLVWVLFLGMAVWRAMGVEEPIQVVIAYLIGAVLMSAFFLAVAWLRDRGVAKGYDDQASLRETIVAEINEEGVTMTQESGSMSLGWDRVTKWTETEEFFLLYESNLFARILPKRALSEEEMGVVREKTAGVRKA